jgi:hypothetical protein
MNTNGFSQYINKEVNIVLADSAVEDRFSGTLVNVDDFGIYMREDSANHTVAGNKGEGDAFFFYPWYAVRYINLGALNQTQTKVA